VTKGSLPSILSSVAWNANIQAAFLDKPSLGKLEASLLRIAVWSKQLEVCDEKNPALCFIREMQVAAQQGAALLGLCIYKASAASARTILETCLYYTYFRTHPQELASLIRVKKYFVSKAELLDYHRLHTPNFMIHQEIFGLLGNLETWYSGVSAVVHGQIPGAWNAHSARYIDFWRRAEPSAFIMHRRSTTLDWLFAGCQEIFVKGARWCSTRCAWPGFGLALKTQRSA
jgi:hypothetical protein